jgi:predicted nuclease with TOPRIM domain
MEAKINAIEVEINIVKAILASPAKYPDKTPQERLEKLKERFPDNDSLFTYFRFAEERLQDQLKELQELLKELQKKENLLQEEKLKQLGSSAGNCCFVVLIDSLIGSIIWFCFLIFISI